MVSGNTIIRREEPLFHLRGPTSRAHLLLNTTWRKYSLGPAETAYCLETFAALRASIAKQTLGIAPHLGLPVLLAEAARDPRDLRSLHSHPDHPLRIIQDYVRSFERPLEQRRAVLSAAEQWAADGGDPTVGLVAIASALHPGLEGHWLQPGSGNTVNLQSGTLSIEALKELRCMWLRILDFSWLQNARDISPLFNSLTALCYPAVAGEEQSAKWRRVARALARELIPAMAARFPDHPGVLLRLQRLNKVVAGRILVAVEADINTLFPEERIAGGYSLATFKKQERRQLAAAKRLAQAWLCRKPAEITRRMAVLEREVNWVSERIWPRYTPTVASILASGTSRPEKFAADLIKLHAAVDLVQPFLLAAARRRVPRLQALLRRALATPAATQGVATLICLTEEVGSKLRTQALDQCPAWLSGAIEYDPRPFDPEVTRALLRHPNRLIAQAAAVRLGSFHREELISELHEDWVAAVTEHPAEEFWIREMLSHDPDLLERWMEAYISRIGASDWKWESGFHEPADTFAILSTEQRLRLLSSVAERGHGRVGRELTLALVGDDEAAVKLVLSDPRLSDYHGAIAHGEPDERWLTRALLALQAGLSPEEIAHASLFSGGVVSWFGSESNVYRQRLKAFEHLAPLARTAPARSIVGAGVARFTRLTDEATQRERHEAVFGDRG